MDNNPQHKALLQRIANRVMLERGMEPEIPPAAMAEAEHLRAAGMVEGARDMRGLLWCSIDNDDSRDLDQLTVAERLADKAIRVMIAIADVDALVHKGSAIDKHAQANTTSVYTAAAIFPMLPERLSTDLTSLNPAEDRLAVVTEYKVAADGSVADPSIYRALVRNQAKLAYNSVAAWLEGQDDMPEALASVAGLADNLRLQSEAAQRLRGLRYLNGALELSTIEARPVFDGDRLHSLRSEEKNSAKEIIEDFMIAANGVSARFLAQHSFPSLRRVVEQPRRWDRIMQIAHEQGYELPRQPDSRALSNFLAAERQADPLRFPDLSLSVIKLLGAGEYAVEAPGQHSTGHFGLAVKDYAHSTAPNRRYPDLITQRLLKAALAGQQPPYGLEELTDLALHCTAVEDAARKVERQVGKSAAALLLEESIGDQFDALVTGINEGGTWVRLLDPPVEGRLEQGTAGLDIGRRIHVQLISTDVERGYIDFKRVR